MVTSFALLATLTCLLFTGAAIYINLVEHPARLSCGARLAAVVWAPSYRRATIMQAALAVASFVLGTITFVLTTNARFLVAATLIGAVVPFTFIAIMPTNKRLLQYGQDMTVGEAEGLLVRWGRLHAVRSVFASAASFVYLSASL